MGFRVELTFDAVEVRLSGWEAVLLVRHSLGIPYSLVSDISTVPRSAAAAEVRGRRRAIGRLDAAGTWLGVFTGPGGEQFWAVGASEAGDPVVIIDSRHERFRRVVVRPPQLELFVDTLQRQVARR